VQNIEDEEHWVEDLGFKVEGEHEVRGPTTDPPGYGGSPSVERTVFVNAANYPTGKLAWRGTHRTPFAGPGIQPVVVDLRDTDMLPLEH